MTEARFNSASLRLSPSSSQCVWVSERAKVWGRRWMEKKRRRHKENILRWNSSLALFYVYISFLIRCFIAVIITRGKNSTKLLKNKEWKSDFFRERWNQAIEFEFNGENFSRCLMNIKQPLKLWWKSFLYLSDANWKVFNGFRFYMGWEKRRMNGKLFEFKWRFYLICKWSMSCH